MLEDVKNQLPEELSDRFSLNRFFAFQRDIINDELESTVPDLVEDALENPTGSYQRVSKFQNEKLMDIDRTTLAIKEQLLNMNDRITTLSAGTGGGLFDAVTDAVGDIIKTWLGWKLLTGGGRRPPKAPGSPETKPPKSSTAPGQPSAKPTKTKKGAGTPDLPKKTPKFSDLPSVQKLKAQIDSLKTGIADAKTRAKLPAKMVGIYLGYELLSGNITLNDIVTGKANEKLSNAATMFGSSYADSYLSEYFLKSDAAKKAAKIAETAAAAAAQPKKAPLLQRWQLDPTDELFTPKGKKGWNLPVTQKLTDEVMARRAPVTSAPSKIGSALSEVGSNMKSVTKSNFITTVGVNLINFLIQLQNLPKDLTDEELEKRIAKLATDCIANVGLQVFVGFVTDLTVVSGVALVTYTFGGPITGTIATAVSTGVSIAVSLGASYAAEVMYGDKTRAFMSQPQAIAAVQKLVHWYREIQKIYREAHTGKKGMVLDLANDSLYGMAGMFSVNSIRRQSKNLSDMLWGSDEKVNPTVQPTSDAYSRQRDRRKYAAGTYALLQDKKKSPAQKRMEAIRRPAREQTPEQAEQIASEDTGTLNPMGAFSLGGMMAKMMKSNGMDPAKADQISSLMKGDGLEDMLQKASDMTGGITGMLGGTAGLQSTLKALGITGTLSDEAAAALGISDPTTINNAISGKATQSSSTDPNRTTAARGTPNAIETMVGQLNSNMVDMYASLGEKNTTTNPSVARNSFPSFMPPYSTAAATIVALRQHGMADVFSHYQGGAATQRMDVGGETFLA